jgi:hypothetical protein
MDGYYRQGFFWIQMHLIWRAVSGAQDAGEAAELAVVSIHVALCKVSTSNIIWTQGSLILSAHTPSHCLKCDTRSFIYTPTTSSGTFDGYPRLLSPLTFRAVKGHRLILPKPSPCRAPVRFIAPVGPSVISDTQPHPQRPHTQPLLKV